MFMGHRMIGTGLAVAAAFVLATPGVAQIQQVDPNQAIDGDLSTRTPPASQQPSPAQPLPPTAEPAATPVGGETAGAVSQSATTAAATPTPGRPNTYQKDDLIGAAEGVFGKGAKGLAGLIEDIMRKQGEPNGYIVGREAGGALAVGLRYGSGTLYHKVEGERPVYWTGPSIGFDAGASGGSTFVLVYNLNDTEDLYQRFPAGEGQVYVVGGFNASYMRSGNVVLIPIRMGVGMRLGINAGYVKFTHKRNWLPL